MFHADLKARDSLALDLMEAVRPDVDRWLVRWLEEARFAKRDFFEERDGTVRLTRPLTSHLAPTVALWRAAVAPVAELVGGMLAGKRLPTPLTQANRSAGRDGIRRWYGTRRREIEPITNSCIECGRALSGRRRRFCCDGCRASYRLEEAVPRFAAAGQAALAEMRAEGRDPAHGGEAGQKRGERNVAHLAAVAAWERSQDGPPIDEGAFARDLLPRLCSVPLRVMAEATGLSQGYCSFVRSGRKVPHRRHWKVLADLASGARLETNDVNQLN